MKYYLSTILLLTLLVASCSNETTNNTTQASNTSDTLSKTTSSEQSKPPVKKVHSMYVAINPTTYIGRIQEHQGKVFVDLVAAPQAESGGNRTDTLCGVSYLPFKDQELYLYQTEVRSESGSSTQWKLSIVKNGTVLVHEHLITDTPYLKLNLNAMKVGDKAMTFIGTKTDLTTEAIEIPYDGKKI